MELRASLETYAFPAGIAYAPLAGLSSIQSAQARLAGAAAAGFPNEVIMDIETARRLLARSVARRRHRRQEAKEDFAFTAGHQWREDDAAELDGRFGRALRPLTTFNTIAPVVGAIAGREVSNRQEVNYLPRQAGSAGVNKVLTAAAEMVMIQPGPNVSSAGAATSIR